jgi:hypothetical protein
MIGSGHDVEWRGFALSVSTSARKIPKNYSLVTWCSCALFVMWQFTGQHSVSGDDIAGTSGVQS